MRSLYQSLARFIPHIRGILPLQSLIVAYLRPYDFERVKSDGILHDVPGSQVVPTQSGWVYLKDGQVQTTLSSFHRNATTLLPNNFCWTHFTDSSNVLALVVDTVLEIWEVKTSALLLTQERRYTLA